MKASDAWKDLTLNGYRLSPRERDSEALLIKPYTKTLFDATKADSWFLKDENGHPFPPAQSGLEKVLVYIAVADARAGRIDEGLQELREADHVCEQIWRNPLFLAQYSGLIREDYVFRALDDIRLGYSQDPTALEKCAQFVRSMPDQPDVVPGLKSDCATFLLECQKEPTLDEWFGGDSTPTFKDKFLDKFWYGPRVRKWEALETKTAREALVRIGNQPCNWLRAETVLNDEYKKWPANSGPPIGSNEQGYRVLFLDRWGQNLAARRVELASLEIRLMQLKSGSLPSKLPQMGDEGTDPFTGRLLIYKRAGSGFVVYSVGSDRVDNGGADIHSRVSGGEYDIVAGFGSAK